MKKKKRTRRNPKSSFRSLLAVRKEIDLLQDFAKRNAEVEFIVPLASGSIKYLGRIVDTTLSDGTISSFHFVSRYGVRVSFMPQLFGKSSVEKIAGFHNGVYVEGKKGLPGFSIVESLLDKKPNPNLASVLETFRTWARLRLDLHVFLNRGGHAISFLGQVRELSSDIFSFTRASAPAQLIIRLDEYRYITMKVKDNATSVTLIDPRTEEMCLISDAATQPEALFNRFIDLTVH